MAVLLLVVIAFLLFAVPPYLSLDPTQSRIPPPTGVQAYYPLLVAHVVFASVAMSTACLQIWPWFRRRFPGAHRLFGRVYVWGGVLPAGIAGLAIGAISPFGPVIRASNVLLALLWLTCTITGFRMARQGRLRRPPPMDDPQRRAHDVHHHQPDLGRVLFFIALEPQLPTTFGGNEALMIQTIAGLSGWLGWVLPLLVTEWWFIERGAAQWRASSASVVASSTLSATPSAASPTDAWSG